MNWVRKLATEAVEDHWVTVAVALLFVVSYTTTLGVAYAIDRNTEYIHRVLDFGEIDD